MQVTCGECQRSLNIPDEKVPEGRAFNVTCPGCKNKIKVEDHLQQDESDERDPGERQKDCHHSTDPWADDTN